MMHTTYRPSLFDSLVEEMADYYRELINFDPCDNSIDAVEDFAELQAWGEDIDARINASPYTVEEIEDAADLDNC